MTVTEPAELETGGARPRLSLDTTAARKLATTTKSVPQMQGITSRWLLRMLPWVEASGGAYRVNRRLSHAVGDGRVHFVQTGDLVGVPAQELSALPVLRELDDEEVLAALASRFVQRDYGAGEVIVEFGHEADTLFLIAHGKIGKAGAGKYGAQTSLGTLADGEYFGDGTLARTSGIWEFTATALTPVTVLTLARREFTELADRSAALREHVEAHHGSPAPSQNAHGEADIDVAAGHEGEADLPGTFADYEVSPREYELSVAQTVLRVHSRVADLYNEPMDQIEQQLRLTIEALRERQEHELINNADFGLLHNTDFDRRIHTRTGPPTPHDLDELLATVWKDPDFFLAHPRTIAAFGRECSKLGVALSSVEVAGRPAPSWRGLPLLPCDKIPVTEAGGSSMLLMRTGEANRGVVGLRQTGLPDEYEPGLNVRFMGVGDQAVVSYLVSAYYSAAVLVPDALGMLENIEVARHD